VQGLIVRDRGFTATELIIGALFAMVVIGSLYGFYREQLFGLLSQEAKTATLEEGRGALDLMVREIRNAGGWSAGIVPSGCARIVEATATRIHIQADLDGNGDCGSLSGEDVLYELSGPTSTCPGTTIRRNGNCLVGNVLLAAGSDLFSYYGSGSTIPLTHPITDFVAVHRVKVIFSVQVANPSPNAAGAIKSVLSSSIDLRN
jgi:Tfp pilus assembly protein PilW